MFLSHRLTDDTQLTEDARFVEEIRNLPVEELCRFGYEEAEEIDAHDDLILPAKEL